MRHEHLVVTVEADLKERIDADLGAGESLEAWVADAVERKLDREAADSDSDDDTEFGDKRDPDGDERDSHSERDPDSDQRDPDDEYDEGFEYVDDCAI